MCLQCECLSHYIPFLVSAVLFWAELEVWPMSELDCGVTLAFTVSPLPFPFLSFFELPLGTSAMSFYKKEIIHLGGKGHWFYCMNAVISKYGVSTQTIRYNSQPVWSLTLTLQMCVLSCVPCQSPAPSSDQLFFLQWSRTSLGPIGHPQLLKHTKRYVSIV